MAGLQDQSLVGKQAVAICPKNSGQIALLSALSCVASVRLTGYVDIELKTGKFQPEYAGKLNFYVALVDDVLRRDVHNETVGILICGTKNDPSVRYSLGRSTSPMAVAAYIYDKLPADEQRSLPNEGHLVAALE